MGYFTAKAFCFLFFCKTTFISSFIFPSLSSSPLSVQTAVPDQKHFSHDGLARVSVSVSAINVDEDPSAPAVLPTGFEPTDDTVISGKGKIIFNHSGNVKFREMIEEAAPEYAKLVSRKEKSAVVLSLIQSVKDICPHSIGFVKQDEDGQWHALADSSVREKVSASLRKNAEALASIHVNNDIDSIITDSDDLTGHRDPSMQTTDQENRETVVAVSDSALCIAAVSKGAALKVKIGNIEEATKAWKKTRRSGSPLLVPATILEMDAKELLTQNIIYLMDSYSQPLSETDLDRPKQRKGIHCLSEDDLTMYYNKHFRSSIQEESSLFGFEDVSELISSLELKELDMRQSQSGTMYICRSSRVGQSAKKDQGSKTCFLEFAATSLKRNDSRCVIPTGRFERNQLTLSPSDDPIFPVTVRVGKHIIDAGLVGDGSQVLATVISCDPDGQSDGLPRLELELEKELAGPARTQRRRHRNVKVVPASSAYYRDLKHNFKELKAGDGPFEATVVRVSQRSKSAFVDLGVKRTTSKGEVIRVLGMLRFTDFKQKAEDEKEEQEKEQEKQRDWVVDAMNQLEFIDDGDDEENHHEKIQPLSVDYDDLFAENDEEEAADKAGDVDYYSQDVEIEDDISHLVSLTDDGSLTYADPDTGEVTTFGSVDIEEDDIEFALEEDDDEDDDMEDELEGLSPSDRLERIEDMLHDDEANGLENTASSTIIQEGDTFPVYIQAVSKQSFRFMATKHEFVAKNIKQIRVEEQAKKKLHNLLKRTGLGPNEIRQMKGAECQGYVKATSKVGDWVYVQPNFLDFPVGVATVNEELPTLEEGDNIRLRFDGIDETRGQLAMTVTKKLYGKARQYQSRKDRQAV